MSRANKNNIACTHVAHTIQLAAAVVPAAAAAVANRCAHLHVNSKSARAFASGVERDIRTYVCIGVFPLLYVHNRCFSCAVEGVREIHLSLRKANLNKYTRDGDTRRVFPYTWKMNFEL